DPVDLVLQPALAMRGLAAVLVLFGVCLPFLVGWGAIPYGIGLVVLGVVGLRIGVRVGRAGVVISNGIWTSTLQWADIEGFRVLNGSSGGVCVLVAGNELKRLPWEELTVLHKRAARSELVER